MAAKLETPVVVLTGHTQSSTKEKERNGVSHQRYSCENTRFSIALKNSTSHNTVKWEVGAKAQHAGSLGQCGVRREEMKNK
jgi:hypothetical protein